MARRFVALDIGSVVKAGDIARLAGASQELLNVSHRPGPRVEKRAAWATDRLGSAPADGLFIKWFDTENNLDRLIIANADLFVKDAAVETYAAAVVGAVAGVFDYANFLKRVYWMAHLSAGVPQRYSFDGTTLDIDPLRERLSSETVVAWKNRLWLGHVYQYVNNQLGFVAAYGTGWTDTNVLGRAILVSGTTLVTLATSAIGGKREILAYVVPASSENTFVVFRQDFLGVTQIARQPMTISLFVQTAAPRSTLVAVGTIRRPTAPNGYRYRVTVGGITGVGEPAWPVAPNATVADGAATWINDGPEEFISAEFTVDNATENGGKWQTQFARARIPPMPTTLNVGARIKFGNTSNAGSIDQLVGIGFMDGRADGEPLKRNFGSQVTVGKFFYDFFNMEFSQEGPAEYPNRIICCEPGDPTDWPNTLYWDVTDGQDGIVVIRTMDRYMAVYKKDAIALYEVVEGVGAAILPMSYAVTFRGVGCIHSRAIVDVEGRHYFLGDTELYAFNASGPPVPIAGEEMREAIFDHGDDWVPDQMAPADRPLLQFDQKNRELVIYTQRAKLFTYNIDTKKWATRNITKDDAGTGDEIADLIAFRNTLYASTVSNSFVRLDPAVDYDQDDAGGEFDVNADVYLHPVESLPRADVLIEGVEIHHDISIDQAVSPSTLTAAVSFDRGVTFPKEHEVSINLTSDRQPIFIPLWQSAPHLVVRLRHSGQCGAARFNIFWAGMWVQDLGEELSDLVPTTISATL